MSTAGYAKLGMTLSAIALGAAGLGLLFAPAEVLAHIGAPASLLPFAQLMGALYLGFALADWTAKDSVIGGIYGRALALGNLVHFLVGALSLAKAFQADPLRIGFLVLYAVFAIFFAWLVFFASPSSESRSATSN
jgi:hypothetical protein